MGRLLTFRALLDKGSTDMAAGALRAADLGEEGKVTFGSSLTHKVKPKLGPVELAPSCDHKAPAFLNGSF